MPNVELKAALDKAACLLRDGPARHAFRPLDRALEIEADNPRLQMLLGIALMRSERQSEGVQHLERAATAVPTSPFTAWNLGLAYFDTGEKEAAIEWFERALRLDPQRKDWARSLQSLRDAGHPKGATYEVGPIHTVDMVAEAGKSWVTVGWVIVGFSAAVALARLFHSPVSLQAVAAGKDPIEGLIPNRDFLSVALFFLSFSSALVSFFWILADLIDRRGRAIWVIPWLICCACGGLFPLAHALYLGIGRRI